MSATLITELLRPRACDGETDGPKNLSAHACPLTPTWHFLRGVPLQQGPNTVEIKTLAKARNPRRECFWLSGRKLGTVSF